MLHRHPLSGFLVQAEAACAAEAKRVAAAIHDVEERVGQVCIVEMAGRSMLAMGAETEAARPQVRACWSVLPSRPCTVGMCVWHHAVCMMPCSAGVVQCSMAVVDLSLCGRRRPGAEKSCSGWQQWSARLTSPSHSCQHVACHPTAALDACVPSDGSSRCPGRPVLQAEAKRSLEMERLAACELRADERVREVRRGSWPSMQHRSKE